MTNNPRRALLLALDKTLADVLAAEPACPAPAVLPGVTLWTAAGEEIHVESCTAHYVHNCIDATSFNDLSPRYVAGMTIARFEFVCRGHPPASLVGDWNQALTYRDTIGGRTLRASLMMERVQICGSANDLVHYELRAVATGPVTYEDAPEPAVPSGPPGRRGIRLGDGV